MTDAATSRLHDNIAPLVSCIIAVYNGETYLAEAIDSLLAQDYPHMEIVVVDDGSTDGTASVIKQYGNRVRPLYQTNQGVSIARNNGVAFSTGKFLCFLDADDTFLPAKTSLQLQALLADEHLDLCDCHASSFWSPELPPEVVERDGRYAQPFWHNALPGHIISWLFRRELWDRVGGFSPGMKYSEDVDWFSRARDLPMSRITLPDVLVRRRLHPGNVTAQRSADDMTSLADALMGHLLRKRVKKGGAS